MAPLLRDEDLDLTVNELLRIRERPSQFKDAPGTKGSAKKGEKRPKGRKKR
jgi:hypothetical protein